jgi:hypothetical protein
VNPKVIVFQGGTNNVGNQPANDAKIEDITRGIQAVVNEFKEKAPEATIILTAIFPRGQNREVIASIERINDNIAKMADGEKIRYLNVNDKMLDAEGRLRDGVMGDGLHPTLEGYQIWADGLKPILTELLGPPAETDMGPPPTGDPSAAGRGAQRAGGQPAGGPGARRGRGPGADGGRGPAGGAEPATPPAEPQ